MKWRYLFDIVFLGAMFACSPDYMSFKGSDCIQFRTSSDEVYTFAYFPLERQKDTLDIEIVTVGEVTNYPREIRLEQITKEWKYIYDTDDTTKIVDSLWIDMPYPAVEGKHFETIVENGKLVLPANQNVLHLKVVVLRDDEEIQKNARTLKLALLPSKDFELGEPLKLEKKIVISDKLERPTRWKDSSYEVQTYLGPWSEVKHRLLIDVTGKRWDNDFLKYILYDFDADIERNYYLTKTKKALEAYNADPANNPPLRDENGNEVVFP